MFVDWNKIVDHYKLFWQYPVTTEKQFYLQNRFFGNYLGFPWATVLDKGVNLNTIAEILSPFANKSVEYYTCCQHIRFRELKPLFDFLNIKVIYTPHKCKGEDKLGGASLLPAPLYAVNFEDEERNLIFRDINFLKNKRQYLYSFLGGLQTGYLSNIRERIFEIPKASNICIENTGEWHFNEMVYSPYQNEKTDLNETHLHKTKTQKYNKILSESRYSLCPSGTGPNSIRFWESLAVGAIPILLSDTLDLAFHPLWDSAILRVREKDLSTIPKLLEEINYEEESIRRENCLKIYEDFRHNYKRSSDRPIVHYCCGSYYQGNWGGVACYDYQVSKVFPHRVFFQGPLQRDNMMEFLERCDNPIVITDNHLSCDVPNKYEIFIVHHGVAMTHAVREPAWDAYWKNLCCSGQNKMLYRRTPDTTKIISPSQFCIDEFSKYYSEDYNRFSKTKILHASELDENKIKRKWNKQGVVLGNWSTENKGKSTVELIQKSSNNNFLFKALNIQPMGNIVDFCKRKQDKYLNSDIFLQLSLSEGNSYATLDALLCGLPVVASNVGLFYKDVPQECFVSVEWEKNGDVEYVLDKLSYAWDNREVLSKNAREWYMENCRFEKWEHQMTQVIMGEK